MSTENASLREQPWVIIANPTAASGRVRRQWQQMQQWLTEHLPNHRLFCTAHAGHAIEIAEAHAQDGSQYFATIGGDGTTHEVLTGILRVAPPDGSITLGIIPMGTGGDFQRLLCPAPSLEDSVRSLTSTARPVDVGHLRYTAYDGTTQVRHFLNSTSFGLGGLVDKYVNETPKFLGGKASFYLATLRALIAHKATRVHLYLDDQDMGVHDITNVFVVNGRYTGAGMLVGKHAQLNSGVFEVSLIPDLGAFWMMRHVGSLYDGSYIKIPGIEAWRAKTVKALHLNDVMGLLDVDGENLGKIDATITMLPGAIRIPNLLPELFDN